MGKIPKSLIADAGCTITVCRWRRCTKLVHCLRYPWRSSHSIIDSQLSSVGSWSGTVQTADSWLCHGLISSWLFRTVGILPMMKLTANSNNLKLDGLRGELSERQQRLNQHLIQLIKLAEVTLSIWFLLRDWPTCHIQSRNLILQYWLWIKSWQILALMQCLVPWSGPSVSNNEHYHFLYILKLYRWSCYVACCAYTHICKTCSMRQV